MLISTRSMGKTDGKREEIPLDDIAIVLGARGTSGRVGRRCDGRRHDYFPDKTKECYQVKPKLRYPDDASESVRIGSERARSVCLDKDVNVEGPNEKSRKFKSRKGFDGLGAVYCLLQQLFAYR